MVLIGVFLITTSHCQSSSSTALTGIDLLSDSIKAILGIDAMLKTFRKVSSGLLPFPLFVPVMPRNRVIKLLAIGNSKKLNNNDSNKQTHQQTNSRQRPSEGMRRDYKQFIISHVMQSIL